MKKKRSKVNAKELVLNILANVITWTAIISELLLLCFGHYVWCILIMILCVVLLKVTSLFQDRD